MLSRAWVLVVDDDVDLREAVCDALEAEGYVVNAAANGDEALAKLRTAATCPRLILLDLMMPVMDGWKFREEQARDPALAWIPVVVFSADSDVPVKASALQASGYLKKPFAVQDLLDTVAAAGRGSSGTCPL